MISEYGKMTLKEDFSVFDLIKSKHDFKCSEIVISKSKIRIMYIYNQCGIKLKGKSFIINAENNIPFSEPKILFKINDKISDYLNNCPFSFFEGVEFQSYQEKVATY